MNVSIYGLIFEQTSQQIYSETLFIAGYCSSNNKIIKIKIINYYTLFLGFKLCSKQFIIFNKILYFNSFNLSNWTVFFYTLKLKLTRFNRFFKILINC